MMRYVQLLTAKSVRDMPCYSSCNHAVPVTHGLLQRALCGLCCAVQPPRSWAVRHLLTKMAAMRVRFFPSLRPSRKSENHPSTPICFYLPPLWRDRTQQPAWTGRDFQEGLRLSQGSLTYSSQPVLAPARLPPTGEERALTGTILPQSQWALPVLLVGQAGRDTQRNEEASSQGAFHPVRAQGLVGFL